MVTHYPGADTLSTGLQAKGRIQKPQSRNPSVKILHGRIFSERKKPSAILSIVKCSAEIGGSLSVQRNRGDVNFKGASLKCIFSLKYSNTIVL